MADRSAHKKRTIEGVQLQSFKDGVWRPITDDNVMFMNLEKRKRKCYVRWSAPHTNTTFSTLADAVKSWKLHNFMAKL